MEECASDISDNLSLSEPSMSNAAKMPNAQKALLPRECTDYGGEPLPNGKFLPFHQVLNALQGRCGLPILSSIPIGKKENVFFLVDNTENNLRSCSRLRDDCGPWKEHGPCPKASFLCVKDRVRSVVSKSSGYYVEQRKDYKRVLVFLNPQPSEEQMIHIQRAYRKHKLDETYQRRVTWILSQEVTRLVACVEYLGMSPYTSINGEEYVSDVQGNSSLQEPSMLNAENMLSPSGTSLSHECMANGGKSLPDGKFLPTRKVLNALHGKYGLPILSSIPAGIKENVFFLVVNTKCSRQSYNQFLDDCGGWKSYGPSPKTSFICAKDKFRSVIRKQSGYYVEQKKSSRKALVFLDPQPSEEDVIHIQRSYRKHSLDETYQRRITWLICQEETNIMPMVACAEYIGVSPMSRYPTSSKGEEYASDIQGNQSLPEPSTSNDVKMPSTLETSLPPEHIANGGEPLPNGKFLPAHKVLDALHGKCGPPVLSSIPSGKKENVFFLVDNTENSQRPYTMLSYDDGTWTVPGGNVKCSYICANDSYKSVVQSSSGYQVKQRKKSYSKNYMVLLNPQPSEEQVVHIQRCYRRHTLDERYQRRATWLISQEGTSILPMVACVEYIGKCPEKSMGRTSEVIELIHQPLQVQPPHKAIDNFKEVKETQDDSVFHECSDAQLPLSKSPQNADHVANFGDNLQEVISLVQSDHPFIQFISFGRGKMPMVILYTEHQIADVRRFCCQELQATVFGFNTVFSLGEVHVTYGMFQHLAVTRKTTGMNPLFPGPIFLHGDSDFETYCFFFCHLATILYESPASPVFGSADEQAMVCAIEKAFPQGRRISCQHHLRKNLLGHLEDVIGLCREDCQTIINSIFGDNGIVHAETLGLFNLRVQITQDILEETAPGPARRYFDDRLLPQLRQNFQTAQDKPFCPSAWTNSNFQSLDHFLKQQISWKSQPLLRLIQNLQYVVDREYCQLKLSLVHSGDFELCHNFSRFGRPMDVWNSFTQAQQQFHFKQFLEACVSEENGDSSSDSKLAVMTPTGGKKTGQRKRKKAEYKRIIIPINDE